MRKAQQKTLEKKLGRWKKVLKLSDWLIVIRYGSAKEMMNCIGLLDYCSYAEKKAQILISKDYCKEDEYGKVWNLDTLILHELIHVVLCNEENKIPKSVGGHTKVHSFIEFVCDTFADIIYSINKRR